MGVSDVIQVINPTEPKFKNAKQITGPLNLTKTTSVLPIATSKVADLDDEFVREIRKVYALLQAG